MWVFVHAGIKVRGRLCAFVTRHYSNEPHNYNLWLGASNLRINWPLWRSRASTKLNLIVNFATTMLTSSNGNIFRVTGHLCREFTGHRWIPRPKASDVDLSCFLWSAPEWTIEQPKIYPHGDLNRNVSAKSIECLFNPSPPSAACMRQRIGWALVQIMACRLLGAKPLS